jgi:hypothetical protein
MTCRYNFTLSINKKKTKYRKEDIKEKARKNNLNRREENQNKGNN